MKVYILFEENQFGGRDIKDIYFTRDAAEKAKVERDPRINKKMTKREFLWVEEREVKGG